MDRPRILQLGKFYPPHHGGMESHLETLARGIAGRVEPLVLVSADGRRTVREQRDGVSVVRVGTLATVASASINPRMPVEIRRARPQLVHFHHPNPTAALALMASGWRGPLVVTYHSDIVRQRVLGRVAAPLTEALLRRASAVIVSSPLYLESSPVLRRHRGRCRVVPFGIDAEAFGGASPEEVAALRERHGTRLVLAAGRLVYYKGFRYLLDAMREVRGRLVLVGDGPLMAPLQAHCRALGIADRVDFLGPVPDLRPYLHAADVFVLPSVERSEAFGLVQLEAMAAGTPVVNTSIPSGVPWVSRHGESGLTVPPRDAEALAAAIGTLLDDTALARRMGEAGRARVQAELTLERMLERTLDIYRSALHGSPLHGPP